MSIYHLLHMQKMHVHGFDTRQALHEREKVNFKTLVQKLHQKWNQIVKSD